MNRIIKTLLFAVPVIFTMACSSEKKEVVAGACGELATFEVDFDFCRRMHITETEFTLHYPKSMKQIVAEEEYVNEAYSYFYVQNDAGIHKEAISVGYSSLQLGSLFSETMADALLDKMRNNLLRMGWEFENEELGVLEVGDQKHYGFRALGKINKPEMELDGNYHVQMFFLDSGSDLNGLFIMMLGNEDAGVKSFKDFESNTCIYPIYKSIEFGS